MTNVQESQEATLRDVVEALAVEPNAELEELKEELIAAVDAAKQGLLQVTHNCPDRLYAGFTFPARVSDDGASQKP